MSDLYLLLCLQKGRAEAMKAESDRRRKQQLFNTDGVNNSAAQGTRRRNQRVIERIGGCGRTTLQSKVKIRQTGLENPLQLYKSQKRSEAKITHMCCWGFKTPSHILSHSGLTPILCVWWCGQSVLCSLAGRLLQEQQLDYSAANLADLWGGFLPHLLPFILIIIEFI